MWARRGHADPHMDWAAATVAAPRDLRAERCRRRRASCDAHGHPLPRILDRVELARGRDRGARRSGVADEVPGHRWSPPSPPSPRSLDLGIRARTMVTDVVTTTPREAGICHRRPGPKGARRDLPFHPDGSGTTRRTGPPLTRRAQRVEQRNPAASARSCGTPRREIGHDGEAVEAERDDTGADPEQAAVLPDALPHQPGAADLGKPQPERTDRSNARDP